MSTRHASGPPRPSSCTDNSRLIAPCSSARGLADPRTWPSWATKPRSRPSSRGSPTAAPPISWRCPSGRQTSVQQRSTSSPASPARPEVGGFLRAVTVRDGELIIEEHPDPVPGAGEVLIRVRAAGINAADLLQRKGFYPAPPGSPPDIPGLELAGEIASVGPGVTAWQPGDRVMAVVGGGAQAE